MGTAESKNASDRKVARKVKWTKDPPPGVAGVPPVGSGVIHHSTSSAPVHRGGGSGGSPSHNHNHNHNHGHGHGLDERGGFSVRTPRGFAKDGTGKSKTKKAKTNAKEHRSAGASKNDRVYYENLNRARKNSIERISGMRLAGWLNSSRSRENLNDHQGVGRGRPTAAAAASSAPPSPRVRGDSRSAKQWRDGISASAPQLVSPGRTDTTTEGAKKKKKDKKNKKKRGEKRSRDGVVDKEDRIKHAEHGWEGSDGPEVRPPRDKTTSTESENVGRFSEASPRSSSSKKKKKKERKREKTKADGERKNADVKTKPSSKATTSYEEKTKSANKSLSEKSKRKAQKAEAKKKRRKELERWESTNMPQWVSKAIELEEEWERVTDRHRTRTESIKQREEDEGGLELVFDDLLQEVSSKLTPVSALTPVVTSVISPVSSARQTPRDTKKSSVDKGICRHDTEEDQPDSSSANPGTPRVSSADSNVQEILRNRKQDDQGVEHVRQPTEPHVGVEQQPDEDLDTAVSFRVYKPNTSGEPVHATDRVPIPTDNERDQELGFEGTPSEGRRDDSRSELDNHSRLRLPAQTTANTDDTLVMGANAKRDAYAITPRNERGSVRNLVTIWELRGKSPAPSPTSSTTSSPSRSFIDRRNNSSSLSRGLTASGVSISRQPSPAPSQLASSTTDQQRKRVASLGRRDMKNLNKILIAIDDDDDSDSASPRASMMLMDERTNGSGHLSLRSNRSRIRSSDISSPGSQLSWRAFASKSHLNLSASSGSDSGRNRGGEEIPSTTSESDSDRSDIQSVNTHQSIPSGITVLQLTKHLMGHSTSSPASQ